MKIASFLAACMFVSCGPQPDGRIPDHVVEVETTEELRALDARLQPAVDEAKRTYPDARSRFLAGFSAREQFFVTVRLKDDTGAYEQVFVLVDKIEGTRITGRVWSEVLTHIGISRGETISLAESDIVDWTILHESGVEEGNFVGKRIDRLQGKRH